MQEGEQACISMQSILAFCVGAGAGSRFRTPISSLDFCPFVFQRSRRREREMRAALERAGRENIRTLLFSAVVNRDCLPPELTHISDPSPEQMARGLDWSAAGNQLSGASRRPSATAAREFCSN
jgi:hypothetical protein